jgi:hypothetical protein
VTTEMAKAKALELVCLYSDATNVQDLIDFAKADNHFNNEDELLAVWGRVCRLLPQKAVA